MIKTNIKPKWTVIEQETPIVHVRVIEVIQVMSRWGKGTESEPESFITEYYSFDGLLLAKNVAYTTFSATGEESVIKTLSHKDLK